MLRAMCHADAFERALGFLLALGGTHAAIGKWKFDVFVDCQISDQIEGLKDEADFAIADAGAIGEFQVGDGLTVELVIPFGGRIEQAENGQQCGFAAAGWAADGDVLTAGDFEIDGRRGREFPVRRCRKFC